MVTLPLRTAATPIPLQASLVMSSELPLTMTLPPSITDNRIMVLAPSPQLPAGPCSCTPSSTAHASHLPPTYMGLQEPETERLAESAHSLQSLMTSLDPDWSVCVMRMRDEDEGYWVRYGWCSSRNKSGVRLCAPSFMHALYANHHDAALHAHVHAS